jgi:hypothetical protein
VYRVLCIRERPCTHMHSHANILSKLLSDLSLLKQLNATIAVGQPFLGESLASDHCGCVKI